MKKNLNIDIEESSSIALGEQINELDSEFEYKTEPKDKSSSILAPNLDIMKDKHAIDNINEDTITNSHRESQMKNT